MFPGNARIFGHFMQTSFSAKKRGLKVHKLLEKTRFGMGLKAHKFPKENKDSGRALAASLLLLQKLIPKVNKVAACIGDRELRTIPTKDLPHGVVFWGGGWCANCQNPRKRINTHHPQFCARDVDC